VRLPSSCHGDSNVISQDLADSIDAPIDEVEQGELREIVEECLSEMPGEYRELVLLRDYMAASWEQVAEETQRPSAEAARMMHSRALIELARLVRMRGVH
jgi:DNA-directed RNA polymerase specialized sigma24 family protein